MKINKIKENDSVCFELCGRLDTITAPQLEKELDVLEGDVKDLNFDFKGLEYVSSAGLRVILTAYKLMKDKGSFKLLNVSSEIREVLEMTGFTEFVEIG